MAYDEELAHRIRELLAEQPGVTEQRMFGGLAFLLNGNMCVAASGKGGLLVRLDPDDGTRALGSPDVAPMEMRGRSMPGWVVVGSGAVAGKRELRSWVQRGVRFASSLPAKG
jgi:TfoX N-terminal domain